VLINGAPLQEPYLTQQTWGDMSPRLVPEEHVFVLGDNRSASNDSRSFGMVPFDDIIGKAWVRYWPPSELGAVKPE
jgi:signal peptidase I